MLECHLQLVAGKNRCVVSVVSVCEILNCDIKVRAALCRIGTLRSNGEDGDKNVKKTISFFSKTTTLLVHHAFLYISLPVFARLRREHA